MKANEPLDRLTSVLARLPGVGRRSAQRMAMRIAKDTGSLTQDLLQALREVQSQVRLCTRCGGITLKDQEPCALCADDRRDARILCVVEDPVDIQLIENSGIYKGRYHALLGKLSPMRGEGIHNPRIESLIQRVQAEGIEEVIVALDTDVESDATAAFLHQRLAGTCPRITRPARGIPVGGGLAYVDAVTLAGALRGRQEM